VLAAAQGVCTHPCSPPAERPAKRNIARDEGMLAVPGEAGSFCTIASSDFDAIPVGSRVVYAKAATADGGLDTDILVNTPSGDTAHGHVVLDGATQTGKVTLAGGTGELAKLAADLLVAPLAEPNYSWEGPYSY
jgi:hypothetical protein